MSKVAAFVPAKGTSDGLPGKNLRPLAGEPLVLRAIRTLLQCESVNEVYLDSEDDGIIEASKWVPGCWVLRRDPALATNRTDGHALLLNEARQVNADVYVQLLPTAPFVCPARIEEVISAAVENGSAALTTTTRLYEWGPLGPLYSQEGIPNRGEMPTTCAETMGLYAITREMLEQTGRRTGRKPVPIGATPIEALDINTQGDWDLAEYVALGQQAKENRWLRSLASYVTSESLAGLAEPLPRLKANCGAAILGRAKTLHLRRLDVEEDPAGIYDALDSYAYVADNDVIVVTTEAPEVAYFGDLNARIARNRGASGAIICGATRDATSTASLGFPVYSQGYQAIDCKGVATVGSINEPVLCGETLVYPGDLVFADRGGACVIPRSREGEILDAACDVVANEKLLHKTLLRSTPREAMQKHGQF